MLKETYLNERITLRRSTILELMTAAGVVLGCVGMVQWGGPVVPALIIPVPAVWIAWRSYRRDQQ